MTAPFFLVEADALRREVGAVVSITGPDGRHAATVKRLAKSGVKNLAVITPGFAADCLETLEEIGVENAEIFHRNGGTNFAVIPCLNDSDLGMDVIETVVRRELGGWIRDPD